jgi:hypothetical protein
MDFEEIIDEDEDGFLERLGNAQMIANERVGILDKEFKHCIDAAVLIQRVFRKYRAEKVVRFTRRICAKKIQRAWRRAVSDPEYKICRDRLMKEYSELNL